ncbi:MAG TPA: hypothetical protein VL361_26965 [Candidatus Limnocylindrales bacterium]|nr:hypothetical protein [Candidatus Limnocylindrales bacterium]
MKTIATSKQETQLPQSRRKATEPPVGKIHPVIVYPFKHPEHYTDLEALYGMLEELVRVGEHYTRPITVIDRKTHSSMQRSKAFLDFRKNTVSRCSDIVDAWCVDTCQMWNTGLGLAFEQGGTEDVYWLIPGDFDYGSAVGREVLARLHDLPEIVLELNQDLCIGEIATDHSNSKQLIDTYGTFALLYNWFPGEAQEIRQFTERPRSEFFAVRHEFLGDVLAHRWYPYEQTVVMLLQAIFNKRKISRFFVGNISDLPEGKESLASAIQQVERTERVLKALWRERNQSNRNWLQQYQALEVQSEQVRRAAIVVLQNLLG